jgi:hypothetical protein
VKVAELSRFKDLAIDWNMGPADAVACYLEYGDPEKETYYFSIDTWQEPYKVRLQKMTKDGAENLYEIELPRKFWTCCDHAKGVYPLPPEVKEWLETLF